MYISSKTEPNLGPQISIRNPSSAYIMSVALGNLFKCLSLHVFIVKLWSLLSRFVEQILEHGISKGHSKVKLHCFPLILWEKSMLYLLPPNGIIWCYFGHVISLVLFPLLSVNFGHTIPCTCVCIYIQFISCRLWVYVKLINVAYKYMKLEVIH